MQGADLGPGLWAMPEVRILNRVVQWTADGFFYEPDPRHSEIVVPEMRLEGAKATPTVGTREQQKAASVLVTALKVEIADESPELSARVASAYRGVAAWCNYFVQDNVDMQYVSKEASRRISKQRLAEWAFLKRLGRYLLGAP